MQSNDNHHNGEKRAVHASHASLRPLVVVALALGMTALAACRRAPSATPVPQAPDYGDTNQWYVVDRSGEADLFYVTSTETSDYELNGKMQHYADMYNDSIRALLLSEMQGIDHMYSGALNFYSPFYRQVTMETYTSEALLAERSAVPLGDVREAFAYYLQHLNGGRPFVLAGYSQGGAGVVELLRTMDDEAYSRMVAAYVIGWKVTDADLAAAPAIRGALDSTDLGVTICYNTVRTPEGAIPIISQDNRLAINPANWCTDDTPATWVCNGDTLTATLDTAAHLVLLDGFSGERLLPLIGRDGNYHLLDITIYAPSVGRNMNLRARRMLHGDN